jgi:hypothetical protein
MILFQGTLYADELDKSFKKLISVCTREQFVINLEESKKIFYETTKKMTTKKIEILRFNETDTKKIMLWNYLRILFPYEMPKTVSVYNNFMSCYLSFDKFVADFSEENHTNWKKCLTYLYAGEIPDFEQKLFACTLQLINKPVVKK